MSDAVKAAISAMSLGQVPTASAHAAYTLTVEPGIGLAAAQALLS